MAKGEIIVPKEFPIIKLDKIDEGIINELKRNSRMPASVISKKVRTRKEVVLYRVDKLFKQGVIADTYALINIEKLGYTRYNVYLRTGNLVKSKEEELLQFLIKHPQVCWVITASGRWDIILQIVSKTTESFDFALNEITQTFKDHLKEYFFAIVTDFLHVPYKTSKSEQKIDFDLNDLEIMNALNNNTMQSYTALGTLVGLSSDAVSYRIKKLLRQNILVRFGILINKILLGYQFYSVLLKINNSNSVKLKGFLDFANTNKYINVVTRQLGVYNYVLDIDCLTNSEFKQILDKIKELFGDIIEDYEATIQFEQRYFTYLPECVIKELTNKLNKKD